MTTYDLRPIVLSVPPEYPTGIYWYSEGEATVWKIRPTNEKRPMPENSKGLSLAPTPRPNVARTPHSSA